MAVSWLSSWFAPSREQKINDGLIFAKSMITKQRIGSAESFYSLEYKIRECSKGPCKHSESELRELADKISPGLRSVTSISIMIDTVKSNP